MFFHTLTLYVHIVYMVRELKILTMLAFYIPELSKN